MPSTPTPPATITRPVWIAWVADALLIILFAALGRRTHESGMDAAGVLITAAPFLVAWAASTALTRPLRTWSQLWPAGLIVWLVTVVGGLLLRVATGDTAAPSFQLVTAGVLGIFLLGRRVVSLLLRRFGHRRS